MTATLSDDQISYLFRVHGPAMPLVADMMELYALGRGADRFEVLHALSLATIAIAANSVQYGGPLRESDFDPTTRRMIERVVDHLMEQYYALESLTFSGTESEHAVYSDAARQLFDFIEQYELDPADKALGYVIALATRIRYRRPRVPELPTTSWRGEHLRGARRAAGLTVEELSHYSGIRKARIRAFEAGELKPSPETWVQLVRGLSHEAGALALV